MKRKKISRKLVFCYSLLIFFIIGVASIFFYRFNKQAVYNDAVSDLSQTTEAIMSQLDARLANMEQTTIDVLSDPKFSENWKSYVKNKDKDSHYLVKRALMDAYIYKSDIRRVAVFDINGDSICTGNSTVSQDEIKNRAKEIQLKYKLDKGESRVLIGKHKDFWYQESDIYVISEIKPIRDRESNILGYIEVQQNIFYLERICNAKWGNTSLSMFVFYGDEEEVLYEYLNQYNSNHTVDDFMRLTQQYIKVQDTGKNIIATASSRYFKSRTVVVLPQTVLLKSMNTIVCGIIIVSMLLTVFTICYIWLATKLILKPVINLAKRMENTDFESLNVQNTKSHTNWETEIIEKSFEEMKERLRAAVEKQKKLTDAQNRTLFNTLQAEIGPHFLYNSLGSIANMCERGENEEAADVCYSLTEILRYAANYAVSEVWLSEEVANARAYLAIMKSRYRQRLNYQIETKGNMNCIMLPKLTIQPLIENAIRYALLEKEEVQIFVSVLEKGSNFIISVTDNGCGFSDEAKQELKKAVDEIKRQSSGEILEKIKFGGMGLRGTLWRLYIYFGDAFTWDVSDNKEETGTTVSLEFNLKK